MERDPQYALAYVGLADSFIISVYSDTAMDERLEKARKLAATALQIDDSLAEAHASMAFIQSRSWQWREADQNFRRALELNPRYATAHHWYSIYLRDVGRFSDSVVEARRALELDPLSLIINANLAYACLANGDANACIEQSHKTLELDPAFDAVREDLGQAYLRLGRPDKAAEEFRRMREGGDTDNPPFGYVAFALGKAGKRAEALVILQTLEKSYAAKQARAMDLAEAYSGLGDKERAFVCLEKSVNAHEFSLSDIRWLPEFDSLRGDARYADILRRMGQTP